MPAVLITGGSGLVGKELTSQLVKKGYEVIILTRNTSNKPTGIHQVTYAQWDIEQQQIDKSAIEKADYIIHLAGAGVADKRWTEERKKEIRDSRVLSSQLIIKGLTETPNKVQKVISASAIGWYGEDKKRNKNQPAFTEEMPPDTSFLGETCRLWEESIEPVKALGKSLVKIRIGIVLSNNGGAFPSFKNPVKFGLAAMLGSGKQIISWVHIEDLCRLFIYTMETKSAEGIYNAVAPHPVSNKQFTLELAQKMKGRFYIPAYVPSFVLEVLLGEMSIEVLKSTTVSSEKIRKAGFSFLYPSLHTAFDNLCGGNGAR